YEKVGTTQTEVERITTVTTFGMFGSFRKNVATFVTTTKSRIGQSNYSWNTRYTYNVKGQVETKIDFFATSKALTHTYSYNGLGNLVGITLSASGLISRGTSNTYDAKGRFIESSTNAAGQVS